MGTWIHRLSNVDRDARTALCAECGPVMLTSNGTGRLRCSGKEKSKNRNGARSRDHGLTLLEARAFKEGKSCEICGATDNLRVDHDHVTMKIRGVLCHHCNVGLGYMRDDPGRLRDAAEYLER